MAKNRVVTAKKIGNRQRARQQIHAAPQPMIAKGTPGLVLLSDGVYVVEFHFARMLSPPLTIWPF